MKASRIATLCAVLGLLAAPASAADPRADSQPSDAASGPQVGRVSGLLRPGGPILDPTSAWLLSSAQPLGPSLRLVHPGHVGGALGGSNASWLLADVTSADPWRIRDVRYAGRVRLGDERLIGWLAMAWSRDVYAMPGPFASVERVSIRIDGPDGSWAGDLTGLGEPTSGAFRLSGTLIGTGAYDGLAAIVALSATGASDGWDVEGLVVRGPSPVG